MVCTSPYPVKRASGSNMYVPCGHCIACRIQRTSQWSLRLMNELMYWDNKAVFLTLTYDDEHLPKDLSLHKDDLQRFFKRLRRDIDFPVKYYACGEYGDLTFRPHYHAIVFGLPYDKNGRQLVKDNWTMCDSLRFDFDNRKKKEQGFAPVSPDDIRYVCGYIQKKYNGKKAEDLYGDKLPPFSLSSRGLGLRYALDNKQKIADGEITFRGYPVSIPRYYLKKLALDSDMVKAQRSEFGFRHKMDYLKERGFNLSEVPLSKLTLFVEEKYQSLAQDSLIQADRELRARYSME